MTIDATNYKPIDPIWGDFYRWRVTVKRNTDEGTVTLIENLRVVIERPAGQLRFGEVIVTPNYTHRVFLAYRYLNQTGDQLSITPELLREGDILEGTYDGVPIRLVVTRRTNPAELNTYITLECTQSEAGTELERLNP